MEKESPYAIGGKAEQKYLKKGSILPTLGRGRKCGLPFPVLTSRKREGGGNNLFCQKGRK